jgi:hypothetical protein
MMKARRSRWTVLLMLLAAATDLARAQAPAYAPPGWKTEVFGGYSLVNIKPGKHLDRRSLNGWAASVTSYQFFRRWGLTAEFGGNGKDGTRQSAYLFGGTYRALQRRRFALTGRILAGATRWEPGTPTADAYRQQTSLTFGFGQSVDFKCTENLALRVQPDLRFVRFQEQHGSSKTSLVRPLSVGLVYKFGRR